MSGWVCFHHRFVCRGMREQCPGERTFCALFSPLGCCLGSVDVYDVRRQILVLVPVNCAGGGGGGGGFVG